RQGRTFERRAPEWYAAHGLDYERRRLAAASAKPLQNPLSQDREAQRAGALFGWMMRRFRSKARAVPDARQEAGIGPRAQHRAGGYFRNLENYRKGTEAAEARIRVHFGVTHRDPEGAVESFRLMLREAPRLALWAANKHPIAFGQPTGLAGAGLRPADFRAAF